MLETLKQYDKDYYAGTPSISDAEYDNLKTVAKRQFADDPYFRTIGTKVADNTPWNIVKHSIAMGSIDNIPVKNFDKYIDEVLANTKTWWESIGKPVVLLQHKLDGLSVNLEYANGKLIHAILRNDGIEGEDIVRNILKANAPIEAPFNITNLHCEIVLKKEDLKKINAELTTNNEKPYANCRNAAAGIARRFDGRFSEYLTVIPFDIIGNNLSSSDISRLRSYLIAEQTDVVSTCYISDYDMSFNDIEATYRNMLESRSTLEYDIDGVVVKVNDRDLRTDNSNRPNWIRAMKFPPEKKLFKVDGIRWNVGKTGRINPVAYNEEGVQFQDKIVKEVTLHNYSKALEYNLCLGDEIAVVISGDVIPKIDSVVNRNGGSNLIALNLTSCPECGKPLLQDGAYLYCNNTDCRGRQTAIIYNAMVTLGIEECGLDTVKALYDLKIIKSIIDVYCLSVEDLLDVPGFAETSANKLYNNIKSRTEVSLETFVASLGIEGIGVKTVEKLGCCTLSDINNMTEEQMISKPGIGKKTAESIKNGLENNFELMTGMLKAGIKIKEKSNYVLPTPVSSVLNGKSFCFTGDSKCIDPRTRQQITREDFHELVALNGGEVKSGVSKKLSYLVLADMASASSKSRKARELGVSCISDMEFLKMIGLYN